MEIKTSQELDKLATALSKAQAEIVSAETNVTNPFFGKPYADLASVWSACRGPLTKNGLSVVQATETNPDRIYIVMLLLHSSGQFIRSGIPLLVGKQDMQGLGSAITYARRYLLAAMCGVAQEDDDGNAAAKSPPKTQPATPTAKPVIAKPKTEPAPIKSRAEEIILLIRGTKWNPANVGEYIRTEFKKGKADDLTPEQFNSLLIVLKTSPPDQPEPPAPTPQRVSWTPPAEEIHPTEGG